MILLRTVAATVNRVVTPLVRSPVGNRGSGAAPAATVLVVANEDQVRAVLDAILGGSVQMYPHAKGRRTAVEVHSWAVPKAAPMFGVEYSYLDGPVLVSVAGKLTPDQGGSVPSSSWA